MVQELPPTDNMVRSNKTSKYTHSQVQLMVLLSTCTWQKYPYNTPMDLSFYHLRRDIVLYNLSKRLCKWLTFDPTSTLILTNNQWSSLCITIVIFFWICDLPSPRAVLEGEGKEHLHVLLNQCVCAWGQFWRVNHWLFSIPGTATLLLIERTFSHIRIATHPIGHILSKSPSIYLNTLALWLKLYWRITS